MTLNAHTSLQTFLCRLTLLPRAGPALVSPTTADALRLRDGRGFLCLAEGSDCVLPVAADASVADGQLAVDAVQQYNLHLGAGISDDFRWVHARSLRGRWARGECQTGTLRVDVHIAAHRCLAPLSRLHPSRFL